MLLLISCISHVGFDVCVHSVSLVQAPGFIISILFCMLEVPGFLLSQKLERGQRWRAPFCVLLAVCFFLSSTSSSSHKLSGVAFH